MFNKVVMMGYLTRDVDFKYLPSGSAAATIRLAATRRYNKQDGSQADETCFVDVKLWGRTAEVANQYLHKGSLILIEGRLNYETWTDANGSKRSKHTITAEAMRMLPTNRQGGDAQEFNGADSYSEGADLGQNNGAPSSATQQETAIPSIDVNADIQDDEIPF